MKKLAYIFGLILVIASCQKDIEIDLNDSNPVIVLEANYTAEDSTVRVKITKTSNYFATEPSPVINNATVTITDGQGNSQTVPSTGNGTYTLENYIPVFNSDYTLNIVAEGQTYTAVCNMQDPVPLEDITYEFQPGLFGTEDGYMVHLNFFDPAGETNYYQVVLTQNGNEMNQLGEMFTQDDLLTDGNLVERPLFVPEAFQLNDTIDMELRTVDKAIYDYVNEAATIVGGSSSAAPANPTTNWDNGALGYFNAYGSSRKSVIIQ